MKYSEEQLKDLRYNQIRDMQKQAVSDKDMEALLSLVIHRFKHGSDATNEYNIPEMAYYFGRYHDVEGYNAIMNEYSWALMFMPRNVFETAKNLFLIGMKFPCLSESEMRYLDKLYSDNKTCEIMENIMFDEELLPRPLKKFNRDALSKKHTDFSNDLLDAIYECFEKNEDNDGYEPMYMYYRPENRIIRKNYQDGGLGDFVISYSNTGDRIYKYLCELFNHDVAMTFLNAIYPKSLCKSAEEFANTNFVSISIDSVIDFAKEYFSDPTEVLKIKRAIAKAFLDNCNEQEYKS